MNTDRDHLAVLVFGAIVCALLIGIAIGLLLVALAFVAVPATGAPASTIAPIPDCRSGWAVARRYPHNYPPEVIAQLHSAHWIGFAVLATPTNPAGMELIQVIRVHQRKDGCDRQCIAPYTIPHGYNYWPSATVIQQAAQWNPGSLWLIGNEPDRRDFIGGNGNVTGQDEMLPELYAVAYHDLRAIVIAADPSARVAPGGVTQPTPLRLEWLDKFVAEHIRLYGSPPVATWWNTHNFILPERQGSWGAEIPPGSNATIGMTYTAGDGVNLTIFEQQLRAMRTWMQGKGYRNLPLVVSEYGGLALDYFPDEVVANYWLTGTQGLMRDATDPLTGMPDDHDRLAQKWLMFALDANAYGQESLVDWASGQLTIHGIAWSKWIMDPANRMQSCWPHHVWLPAHRAPATWATPYP